MYYTSIQAYEALGNLVLSWQLWETQDDGTAVLMMTQVQQVGIDQVEHEDDPFRAHLLALMAAVRLSISDKSANTHQ